MSPRPFGSSQRADPDSAPFIIPIINTPIYPGESVALLGVKETDISEIFQELDADTGMKNKRRHHHPELPSIHCVKRRSDLFEDYTGYENILLSEHFMLPYSKKQLVEKIEEMRAIFSFDLDFNQRVSSLTTSQQVLLDAIRAYIIDPDIVVYDRLYSQLEYRHANILTSMAIDQRERGKHVIYLTAKWEDAVKIATRILVVMDAVILDDMSAEQVRQNPQKLVYLLSGRTLIEERDKQNDTTDLLNMLYTGAEYLADNYEIADAMKYVTRSIAQLIHADGVVIYLLDDDSEQVHCFSHFSSAGHLLEDSFLRYHINSAQELFYYNFEDRDFKSYFINPTANKTMLCLPIQTKGKAFGLLQVAFHRFFVYDDEQQLYLKSFCREIVLIVETSKLMGHSILLQESNHRIKNNLQIIVNLIGMQQVFVSQNQDANINNVLNSIISRIYTIASVHELLSDRSGPKNTIGLGGIISAILKSFSLDKIDVVLDLQDVYISHSRATSISMVINELVTNAVKYAFAGRESGSRLTIGCKKNGSDIVITVKDNGCGLPEEFNLDDTYSLGYSIIKSIVQIDLKGQLDINSGDQGTVVSITIPNQYSEK